MKRLFPCFAALAGILPAQEPPPEGGFSLVVLPDTQYYYSDQGTGNFAKWIAQMSWIRENADFHNIRYVLHLGDITDEADHSGTHRAQWNSARMAVGGILQEVPVALVTGNHDGLDNSHTTLFSEPDYFGEGSLYASQPSLVETMEPGRYENTVHRFTASGLDWTILCLEWGPSDAAVAWAEDVLEADESDRVILLTHAYLFRDSARYDWDLLGRDDRDQRQSANPLGYGGLADVAEGANDGEDLWDRLVRKFPQMTLVLNGHVSRSGHGRRVSTGDGGNKVEQLLVNFQHWDGDGNARMMLITVDAKGELAQAESFSPYSWVDVDGPDLDFNFSVDPGPLEQDFFSALDAAGVDHRLRSLRRGDLLTSTGGLKPLPVYEEGPDWVLRLEENDQDSGSFGFWIRGKENPHGPEPLLRSPGGDEDWSIDVRTRVEGSLREGVDRRIEARDEGGARIVLQAGEWSFFAFHWKGARRGWYLDGEWREDMEEGRTAFQEFRLSGDLFAGVFLDSSVLGYGDFDRLWRSGLRQPGEATGDSFPGLSGKEDPGGGWIAGTPEDTIYRVQDVVGRSRDPHSRFLRYPQDIVRSDGILLSPAPVGWKLPNRLEGLYFGEDYASAWRSALHLVPGYWERDDLSRTTFFPFAGGFRGGHVGRNSQLVEADSETSNAMILSSVGTGRTQFRWDRQSDDVILLQPVRPGVVLNLAESDSGELQIHIHREMEELSPIDADFSFLLVDPREPGWVGARENGADPAEGSPWRRTSRGVYEMETPHPVWVTAWEVPEGKPVQVRTVQANGSVEIRLTSNGEPVDGDFNWASWSSPRDRREQGWELHPAFGWTYQGFGEQGWIYTSEAGWIFPEKVHSRGHSGWYFTPANSGSPVYWDVRVPGYLYRVSGGWEPAWLENFLSNLSAPTDS